MATHSAAHSFYSVHSILRKACIALACVLGVALASASSGAWAQTAAGISHLGTNSATGSGNVTLARPANAGAGDVLIARVANRDSVSTNLAASGWTQVGVTQSAGLLKSWVFLKVLGAGEPASYTFQLDRGLPMAGTVSAFRGVDALNPVDAANGFSGKVNGSNANFVGLPITSPAGNAVALWWGTQLWAGAACPSPGIVQPAGFGELQQGCMPSASNGLLFDTASMQLGAAARQPAWSGASVFANTNIVQALALRPAGVPISHRGTATAAAAAATTLSIAKPGATHAGDVLLARVANRDGIDVVVTAPAGWWQVRSTSSTYSIRTTIFAKIATAVEPNQYVFTFSRARSVAGSVSAFAGVDTALPIDDSQGKSNSGSTVLTPGAGLTTSSPGGASVWFATQAANQASCSMPLTPPATHLEVVEACLPSASAGLAFDVAFAPLAAAGAQPLADGSSAVAATNTTAVIALRAAPAVQVADDFQSAYVTVGKLWDGLVNGQHNTAIPLTELDQPSGLGYSRLNPNVMYVNSEKDRQTMLAFAPGTGQVLGKYRLTIPNVYDWEDMAVGPCPAGSCIFAADIGGAREFSKPNNVYTVVRVAEPDILGGEVDAVLTGDYFPFVYPDGAKRDSEAFMVHPQTGEMYVIAKTTSGVSGVYKFPLPLPPSGTQSTLVKVGDLTLPLLNNDTNSVAITGAAVHPAGGRFIVRTYRAVYEFRGSDGSVESTISGTRVALTDTVEGQGESIEYASDGSAYFTLSEKVAAPYTLKRVDRR